MDNSLRNTSIQAFISFPLKDLTRLDAKYTQLVPHSLHAIAISGAVNAIHESPSQTPSPKKAETRPVNVRMPTTIGHL